MENIRKDLSGPYRLNCLNGITEEQSKQALTGLKMKLEMILDIFCPYCTARGQIIEAVALLSETLELTRHIAHALRPPGLETLGLKAALINYCRAFSRRTGLSIHFEGSDIEGLSEEVSICFYRVLQEALTNVAKHSRAANVEVGYKLMRSFSHWR